MSNQPDFEVVPDEWRVRNRGRGVMSPFTIALLEGKTIMVKEKRATGGFAKTLKQHGMRLHQHQREEGLVLWADKIEDGDADQS